MYKIWIVARFREVRYYTYVPEAGSKYLLSSELIKKASLSQNGNRIVTREPPLK